MSFSTQNCSWIIFLLYIFLQYSPVFFSCIRLYFTSSFQPIFFNKDVFPVCLRSGTVPPPGTDCFVTGWGSTTPFPVGKVPSPGQINDVRISLANGTNNSEAKRAAEPLRQVDVKIIPHDVCLQRYAQLADELNIALTDREDVVCGYNVGKGRYNILFDFTEGFRLAISSTLIGKWRSITILCMQLPRRSRRTPCVS